MATVLQGLVGLRQLDVAGNQLRRVEVLAACRSLTLLTSLNVAGNPLQAAQDARLHVVHLLTQVDCQQPVQSTLSGAASCQAACTSFQGCAGGTSNSRCAGLQDDARSSDSVCSWPELLSCSTSAVIQHSCVPLLSSSILLDLCSSSQLSSVWHCP